MLLKITRYKGSFLHPESHIMTLLNLLKTLFLLTIILYIAPFCIENIKQQYIHLLEPQTPVGVISINEPLHNAYVPTKELHAFFKDPNIKGIVIKINCAETSSGTSQSLFHDIRCLKKQYPKPIIALVENICLSGAYLIASACDYIIAPESALIGNIGQSFSTQTIQQSIPENSADNLEHESYQQLTKQIALSRKLSLTTTTNWADGKIFTGTQAIALGLINEIGSLCTVIKIIKEKALIEGEIEWIEHDHNKHNPLHIFFGNERTIT
jgi:ClpP class serine protease